MAYIPSIDCAFTTGLKQLHPFQIRTNNALSTRKQAKNQSVPVTLGKRQQRNPIEPNDAYQAPSGYTKTLHSHNQARRGQRRINTIHPVDNTRPNGNRAKNARSQRRWNEFYVQNRTENIHLVNDPMDIDDDNTAPRAKKPRRFQNGPREAQNRPVIYEPMEIDNVDPALGDLPKFSQIFQTPWVQNRRDPMEVDHIGAVFVEAVYNLV